MAKYIPIGEPLNQAELEGVRALRDSLPDHFTILGNFELRVPNRANTLEFDAVVIGEHTLYTVEIKGWSGRIDAGSRHWQLEWGRVENPLRWLESKTKALKGYISSRVPELPTNVECQCFVFLPRDVELSGEFPNEKIITNHTDILDAFVNRDTIEEIGPGPMLDSGLRDKVQETLLPLLSPSRERFVVSDYEIEAELDVDHDLYREFVGRHKLLTSRNKVRIKMYSLDPLFGTNDRQAAFDRVLRDMEAITMLDDNPYIARGFDVIRDRDDEVNFYLVSEWVGPRTLRSLTENGDADESTIGRLVGHLLRAVDFMHTRGIVHRNLSPEVIYITDDLRVPLKITDFEFARIADMPSIVGDFADIGTAGFIAPELWKGQDHDHRVDIFSCGAIVFECLTGQQMFGSLSELADPAGTWDKKCHTLENDSIRQEIGRCLAVNPDDRPKSLTEISKLFAPQIRR